MSSKPRFVGEKVRLGDVVSASSERNKGGRCSAVYSVTNSQGFVPSEDLPGCEAKHDCLQPVAYQRRVSCPARQMR